MTIADDKTPARYRIDFLEMLACLVTLETFATILANRAVFLYGDNSVQVTTMRRGFGCCSLMLLLAEQINRTMVALGIKPVLAWIPSKFNLADNLTRGLRFTMNNCIMKIKFGALPTDLIMVVPKLVGGFQGVLTMA